MRRLEHLEGRRLLAADFNMDGAVDVNDVNQACVAGDRGSVRDALQEEFLTDNVGDFNLDRVVDSGDLVRIFAAGKYESFDGALWSEGDANCDGYFDSGDLVFIMQKGFYETETITYEPPSPPTVHEQFYAVCGLVAGWAGHDELPASPEYEMHDHNNDGAVNLDDAAFLFESSTLRVGDLTGDGVVNDEDVDRYVRAIDYLDQISGADDCIRRLLPLDTLYVNHVDPEHYLTDFNLDGRVGDESIFAFPRAPVPDKQMKAFFKDMDNLCYGIQDRLAPNGKDWLLEVMDVNDDQDITLEDLEQVADQMDLVIGDIEMWWVTAPPKSTYFPALDGIVDHAYFQEWESPFSQARRSGEQITWSQGDLNCNGIADEGDIPE